MTNHQVAVALSSTGLIGLLRRLRAGADCVVCKLPLAFSAEALAVSLAAESLGTVERTVKMQGHTQLVLVQLADVPTS